MTTVGSNLGFVASEHVKLVKLALMSVSDMYEEVESGHEIGHITDVINKVSFMIEMAKRRGDSISHIEERQMLLGAAFHDLGLTIKGGSRADHHEKGVTLFRSLCEKGHFNDYGLHMTPDDINAISDAIYNHRACNSTTVDIMSKVSMYVADADSLVFSPLEIIFRGMKIWGFRHNGIVDIEECTAFVHTFFDKYTSADYFRYYTDIASEFACRTEVDEMSRDTIKSTIVTMCAGAENFTPPEYLYLHSHNEDNHTLSYSIVMPYEDMSESNVININTGTPVSSGNKDLLYLFSVVSSGKV